MTGAEMERFEALRGVFERNFRITRLYAAYLEHCPELIKEEPVKILTSEGDISRTEAVVALVSEILGLDFEKAGDRELIRDYLTPSVRLLDAKRYENNPYYKSIRIDNVVDGRWELRREAYEPYRAIMAGDMILRPDFSEVPPLGFFTERFEFPAVLEDGNEWMTLTPVDLDTAEEAIEAAHGDVVTFGLGLGYYAYMVSEKETVRRVVVVEKSAEVIALFRRYILPQFAHGDKIEIVEADAFEYAERVMPGEGFDVAFVDTWRDASDGTPMYKRMKKLEKLNTGTHFLYWIENFLISRARAERFAEIEAAIENGDANAPKSYSEVLHLLTEGLLG